MALTDSLISYWRLDEASGNALDAHGANTLTETSGTIAAATGILSGARDFELGDTEYFAIADNADLSVGDIDFEFQAWVKFESIPATSMILLGKQDSSTDREYFLIYSVVSSRFNWSVSVDGSATVTVLADNFGAATTGVWYFVHCWHDSVNDVIGISVNNGTANTTAHTTGVRNATASFRLGAVNTTAANFLDGLLDEVAFWKRMLTPAERSSLYNSGLGLAYPLTVISPVYWNWGIGASEMVGR